MTSRRAVLAGLGAGTVLSASQLRSFAQAASSSAQIVSVGGAITETLFALGLGAQLRAADTTSTFPAAANALPKVGYLRQLSAEGILAMKPDLVLLSGEAGPAAAVAHLKTAGVALEQIDIGRSPAAVTNMVEAIGAATGKVEVANTLAATVTDQFKRLDAELPDGDRKSVLLLLAAGNGPLLGAGANTAASAAINLAGGALAFPDMQGYKAVSLEPVLAADPDWIILPSHVAMALGGPEGISALDVVARTRAGPEGRVAIIDSHYLLGFGPRAPQAAADLATLLYPDADIPLLNRDAAPSSLVSLVAV
ncbi:MAG: ABC transporter substrate-binding protein [Parvibaculaceae bacterium]|nr:ABC transporter substrate-binding protein [Parvibaculaceae bacterium]HBM87580.1 hemin ABC transporter substrate-binding protein [Rhodobiaceae bacterium]